MDTERRGFHNEEKGNVSVLISMMKWLFQNTYVLSIMKEAANGPIVGNDLIITSCNLKSVSPIILTFSLRTCHCAKEV